MSRVAVTRLGDIWAGYTEEVGPVTDALLIGDSVPDGSTGDPFVDDDFSSGDKSYDNGAGFGWGSSIRTDIIATPTALGGSGYVMRHEYPGSADGSDAQSEQRFSIGTQMTEFWMETELWYADGAESPSVGPRFEHRGQTNEGFGSEGGKMFMAWGGGYTTGSLKVGVHQVSPSGLGNRWGFGYRHEDGVYKPAEGLRGDALPSLEVDAYGSPWISGNVERGEWITMRLHAKRASAYGASDGAIRLETICSTFGTQTIRNEPVLPLWETDTDNFFDYGYVAGWSNSGYDNTTYIYRKNFKMWDTDPGWW